MAVCVFSTGFSLDCRKSIGGVDEVWIAELEGIDKDNTTIISGVVTAMAMLPGKRFYNYKLRKNTSEIKADNAGDVANGAGYIMQSVQIQLDKFDVAKRNELRVVAQKPCVIIGKDKTGQLMVCGYDNGLDLTTGTGGTGKEANSLNGFNLTFTGEELEYPYGISQSIVDTLIV